jgi:uncharacterized protein (TIGR02118 family)
MIARPMTQPMIRMNVFYPWKKGARFDWAYYTGSHIPMVARKLGEALKGICVEKGLSGEALDSKPIYVAMAHLSFDSMADFDSAFGPVEAEITADIPKYTSITPVVQFSEVKAER